jgi:hypothetical protein
MNKQDSREWFRMGLVRTVLTGVMATVEGRHTMNKDEWVAVAYEWADEIMKQSGVPDEYY